MRFTLSKDLQAVIGGLRKTPAFLTGRAATPEKTMAPETNTFFVAERGYLHNGEMRWVGEWSSCDLRDVRDFLTKFHVRPDEQTRIVKSTTTITREVIE